MGEIIEKVKEKAKEKANDVKDTIIDISKLPLKISILSQKFVLELNGALAMENAGIERLNTRISETIVPEAKQRMELHLQESLEHQNRLQTLVTMLGGTPTQDKLGLPLPKYPQDMFNAMTDMMTRQEYELKRSEEDQILEKAEVICYYMLIQKAKIAGGIFLSAVEPLTLNMKDEENMAEWIKTNAPGIMTQLWPKMQSAIVSATAPHLSTSPTQIQ
jgi:ferritin-like metal-binding protein YciE